MIDDKLREQLSALLDNQLLPEERRSLEEKIRQDPEVRAEWEALRQFAELLAGTAPDLVAAPPDFRARILDRWQGLAPGKPPAALPGKAVKGAAGSSLFSFFSLPAYAAAGAVLAGLVGTMVYLDYQQAHKPAPKPAGQNAELPALGAPPVVKTAPAYLGTPRPVSPGDIQGAAIPAPTPASASNISGKVYTIGQGRARSAGSEVSQPWNQGRTGSAPELNLEGAGVRPAPGLESAGSWTSAQVNQVLARLKLSSVSANQIMNLAQQNHLNPGLLCSALQAFPGQTAEELALDLRRSLNASVKLPGDMRLKKCVQDLGGKPGDADKWKKYLQP